AEAGDEVGGPTDALLHLLARVAHDRGVESHAGHDEEGVPVHRGALDRGFGLTGVLGRRLVPGVELEPGDVDGLVASAAGDAERGGEVGAEGGGEVAREEVAGAPRQQPHRRARARERDGDRADRAVAAERADDVDPLLDRLPGLAGPRVLDRRLDEERLLPPELAARGGQLRLDGGDVVELRRVDDDRGAPGGLPPIARPPEAAALGPGPGAATPG